MTRSIAPLKQAKDAVVLDTSSLNQEESLAALKAIGGGADCPDEYTTWTIRRLLLAWTGR